MEAKSAGGMAAEMLDQRVDVMVVCWADWMAGRQDARLVVP